MDSSVIAFSGQNLLLSSEDCGSPFVAEAAIDGIPVAARRSFTWMGRDFSAVHLDAVGLSAATSRGLLPLPVRQALSRFGVDDLRPALKGLALLNWLEGARHCGACGVALVDGPGGSGDGEAAARVCPSCGREHFPRISPAVIVLVTKDGKALLARNARMPPGGRFGLLAGFVEAGESLEEAASREIREEAGIEIRNLRYVASQPWPFPDSLMLAFTAEWASGDVRPDGREIAELRWCGSDELPEIPPIGSVARSLIDDFAAGTGSGSATEGASAVAGASDRATPSPSELRRESSRLILRPPTSADADAFLEFVRRNREYLAPWEPVREESFYTREGISELFDRQVRANRSGDALHLLLFEKATGSLVGTISANNIVYGAFRSCQLGYRLGESAVGKGFMREALGEVIDLLFGAYGLHRIEANVMPHNDRSRATLRRIGFTEEGLSRRYLKIAGRWEDHIHYVLLARELHALGE